MPKNSMKRIGGNLLLVAASTVCMALLLEGVFRVLDLRGHYTGRTRNWRAAMVAEEQRIPGVRVQFKPYSQFYLRYDNNPRGYFDADNGLTYQMNQYGFRGPDYARQKPANTVRIGVLGDSFTFGEGVKLEDTFCARLQHLLTQRAARPVQVLNWGVSQWGTLDEINYLTHAGAQFEPDIVLVIYVLNDAEYAGGLDFWGNHFRRDYQTARYDFLYVLSYFYERLARNSLGNQYAEQLVRSALQEEQNWQQSFDYLVQGQAVAASFHSEYAVIIFPFMYELNDTHPFLPIHRKITQFCQESGIPVFDLLPAFDGQPYEKLWVHPTDQHPNEKGHAIAAAALVELLSGFASLSGKAE